MVEKLKEGLIFKINKDAEEKYIILASTKSEKIDFEKNTVENLQIDIVKTFMIEYNPKTNIVEYSFENNIMRKLSEKIPLGI